MTARNFYVPGNHAFNSNGLAVPGATASLYTTGTTTPVAFYSDSALSVSLGSTITANGVGRFPIAYGSDAIGYRLILKDATGAELDDIDPFYFGTTSLTLNAVAATPQMYGALADGATDDTTAIAAALAANSRVHFPAGTYITPGFSVPANTEITTEGHDTIIKQKSGTATGTRIITVTGSNVRIGDLAIQGQLNQAGDTTGEQNHGIFIYIAAADTASRSNITIGNIRGTNIRGDVVTTGVHPTAYTAGYRLSQITIGKVIGSNVYRNVVSITGGSDISIDSVTGTQVGLYTFDAETDIGSGPITGLSVGYIKGRTCGFVAPTAADYISAWAGHIDLDPSYTTDSTPAYGGTVYQNGLYYRNIKALRVERLYANGHYAQTIKPVTGALARQNLSFGTVEIPSGCTTEATNLCLIFGDATTYLTIENLFATTSAIVNHAVFNAVTNAVVNNAQIALAPSTHYMRSGTDCTTLNLNVTRVSGNGGTVDLAGTRCHYRGGTQLCDYFFNFATRCTATGVEATAASTYDNSGTTNVFFASRIGGTYVYFNDQINGVAVNVGGAAAFVNVTASSTITGSNLSGTNTGDGAYTIQTKILGYTATETTGDIIVKADLAAGFTVVLPTAVSNKARFTFKKIQSAGAIVIDGSGTETIDGALTATLNAQNESITICSDNANWIII